MAVTVMACNEQRTSVEVKKNGERFELLAKYPQNKQLKIDAILHEVFKGRDTLLSTNQLTVGKEIKLSNGAVFYARYNPGKLEMEMLLERNNIAGHKYFDTLSTKLKKALE